MILLYDTAAKKGEILNLFPKDIVIDTESPYVIINGKDKKIRLVPIMKETVQHYKSYMRRFHGDSMDKTPLFYTEIHSNRQNMSGHNVARFIKKYALEARDSCREVPSRVTPHVLCHSRALSLYRKGVPLPLISEWLGAFVNDNVYHRGCGHKPSSN